MHLIFSKKEKEKRMHLTISLIGKVNSIGKVIVKQEIWGLVSAYI